MSIRTALWKVGSQPERLIESSLAAESLLEQMIVAAPQLLSEEWMLIGQQVNTGYGEGRRVDLLAIAPDGSLVLIELKRNRTSRDVVAQALDYAGWVETLTAEQLDGVYENFRPGKNLAQDFSQRFGQSLPEETLDRGHQIIVVAASLDDSTERIVKYLNARLVPINVLFFQVFASNEAQILSRTWLLDPIRPDVSTAAITANSNEPWNKEFYCSFGEGPSRSWQDAVDLGFFCAGGGLWYSKTLQLLNVDDRIWVRVPGSGFVGMGRVTGRVLPASEFQVDTPTGPRSVLEVAKRGTYHQEFVTDPERCEYFVPVQWLATKVLGEAIQEVGFFGNQNSVCRPTTPKWRSTVERLKVRFADPRATSS